MWLISGSLHQKSAIWQKQSKKTTILIYSHTHKLQNAHEATANGVLFLKSCVIMICQRFSADNAKMREIIKGECEVL